MQQNRRGLTAKRGKQHDAVVGKQTAGCELTFQNEKLLTNQRKGFYISCLDGEAHFELPPADLIRALGAPKGNGAEWLVTIIVDPFPGTRRTKEGRPTAKCGCHYLHTMTPGIDGQNANAISSIVQEGRSSSAESVSSGDVTALPSSPTNS